MPDLLRHLSAQGVDLRRTCRCGPARDRRSAPRGRRRVPRSRSTAERHGAARCRRVAGSTGSSTPAATNSSRFSGRDADVTADLVEPDAPLGDELPDEAPAGVQGLGGLVDGQKSVHARDRGLGPSRIESQITSRTPFGRGRCLGVVDIEHANGAARRRSRSGRGTPRTGRTTGLAGRLSETSALPAGPRR